MKKILIFLLLIGLSMALSAQFLGLGTSTQPYRGGTLKLDTTWYLLHSPIYVSGDLTIGTSSDAGHLTIEAGVTVLFVSTGADLIITGLGQLTADGSPSSKITFTRNYPTITYWGHISFQSMGSAGASVFDNCIFEYGDVSSFPNSDLHGGGGAIFIDFNNVSITNCIIQHNKAQWGGGIFVSSSRYPAISNCNFYDNSAKEAGGGIYLWNYASSVIENCIFDSNHCDGTSAYYYTGGGLASQSYGSVFVNNCTFVNNSSSRTDGQSLMFYGSTNNKAINCIFWGTGAHLYYGGTYTINYCAVQGSAPSGTGNFVLNSSNSASDGPNFTKTDGTDWSIKVVSPCRDAGTTPSPTVPNDYIGNPRIGLYDVGAYEVQYNGWKTTATSTDWATGGNWNGGVPTSSQNVVIPTGATNYPTGSSSQDYTIGDGYGMVIERGACVTLNALTNNGILKLDATSAGFASLIINSYIKGKHGTEEIQLFLTGGGGPDYKWHYISSPVISLDVSTFTVNTLDLAQWIDGYQVGSIRDGWVAYDGYIYYSDPADYSGPTFNSFSPGIGYNFWDNLTSYTYTFSGDLNTTEVDVELSFAGDADINGFNLLGNPFSSGLNWNDIADSESYPANTSKGIYFTRDNTQCTYINGISIPGDVSPIIPPMQGFFVKTYSAYNHIILPLTARTHTNIHPRYKGETIIPLVRLSIVEDTISNDETVVRFDEKAKSYRDNDYDAFKMFLPSTKTYIYTSLGGTKYSINGLPFPVTGTVVEIPVVVNMTTAGNHRISATQLQGLDDYYVKLTDNVTGFTADLKTTPDIIFSSTAGTITGRFVLKVSTINTGIEIPVVAKNIFNIYPANNMINIQTISDNWDGMIGTVKVLDITGKIVTNKQDAEFSKNSLIQVSAPVVKGIYIVELKSGVMRYVGKVVIR